MSLFENSPDYPTAALDIDIPSGVWTPWSPLSDSQDLACSLVPYGHFDALLKTGPISCLETAAVADSRGDTADITQDPMALCGAQMHDADSEGLAKLDHRLACSTHPLVRALSTGDDASLALLATIGVFGMPPDMSRTAPIMTADVLALSLAISVTAHGCGLSSWSYPKNCGDLFPPICLFAAPSGHTVSSSNLTGSGATTTSATPNMDPAPRGGHDGRSNGSAAHWTAVSSNTVATGDSGAALSADVKIMYWNIFHHFTLKLTSDEFSDLLKPCDIMIFGETDMLPGEEDTADIPRAAFEATAFVTMGPVKMAGGSIPGEIFQCYMDAMLPNYALPELGNYDVILDPIQFGFLRIQTILPADACALALA
ncbi:hypothetical protein C8J57DRAFT_1728160 [Mycena rebaudengoi]|nr:hypothetical protein C8J57DRAFT_1728160 [Mycena rebaudengoi]